MNKKTLLVNGEEVTFAYNRMTPILFKKHFRKKLANQLNKLERTIQKGSPMEAVENEAPPLIWILAKTANNDVQPFEQWKLNINFPMWVELLDKLTPLLRMVK